MTISDKARKILWGRSGNRCAFCKRELVVIATNQDEEAIVGDECHIISGKANGPRHDSTYSLEKLDRYENLILLCRVHHKMIDDQVNKYSTEVIKKIKKEHEFSIATKLDDKQNSSLQFRRVKKNIPEYLMRFTTGKQLTDLVSGSHAYYMNHDELKSVSEVELVGGFFQWIQDLIDIGDSFEAIDRVRTAYTMTQVLQELNDSGFWAFGGYELQYLEGGISNEPSAWNVIHLAVLRNDNPNIILLDKDGDEKVKPKEQTI